MASTTAQASSLSSHTLAIAHHETGGSGRIWAQVSALAHEVVEAARLVSIIPEALVTR